MAYTTEQLLAQLLRYLPEGYQALVPHIAGLAAAAAGATETADDAADSVTIAGASGQWLTLMAKGYGVEKVENENDPSLRQRLRYVERRLTIGSIEAAVNAILDTVGASDCRVADWWEDDVSCWFWDASSSVTAGASYFDEASLGDYWLVFTVFVPMIGNHPGIGSYLGDIDDASEGWDNYLDIDCYLGGDAAVLSPIYDTIIDQVERIKAAGVRWWLIVDWAGEYL
jgi:hypothetical protein